MTTFAVLLAVCAFTVTSALNFPGKAILWTNIADPQGQTKGIEISKTVTSDAVGQILADNKENYDFLAVFSPENFKEFVSDKNVMNSFNDAAWKATIHTIYLPNSESGLQSIHNSIADNQPIVKISAEEFATIAARERDVSGTLQHHVATHDIQSLSPLFSIKDRRVLFVAYQEPESLVPERHAHFNRVLQDSSSTADSTSIYYKPEGAEYSIYYANTYLYITPDLFTGLMTAIFMVFVALIGVNCLGKVQGITSFYDKMPAVGREN
jgi:hypothetical protein